MKPLKTKKELLAVMGRTRSRFSKYFGRMTNFLLRKSNREVADRNLVYNLASSKIPSSEQMKHLNKTLSKKESLIIRIALVIVLANLAYLGFVYYNKHVIISPVVGGTYYEGVVGYPKTINPLYNINRDVDYDLTQLIYSSLYRYDENGQLVNDLAENIETSDNKIFIITLKENVKWHSGETLTADDVVFTFNLITNPNYNSPLQKRFPSVSVEKISNNQVKFTLPAVYSAFAGLLTFGILPQSIWENISPDSAMLTDLNLEPIGSGPYKFSSLLKKKKGELKEYRLVASDDYYGQKPYIKNIIFKFYPDTNGAIAALNDGDVYGISSLPLEQKSTLLAQNSLNFYSLNSSQEDLIFFNSNNNRALSDLGTRQALANAIDKKTILEELFENFYKTIDGPLTKSSFAYTDDVTKYSFDTTEANSRLDTAGWLAVIVNDDNLGSDSPEIKAIVAFASSTSEKANGLWRYTKDKKDNVTLLTIKLSVVDGSNSYPVAERIKAYWDAVGAHTTLNVIAPNDVANLIASRSFEALLFSEVMGGDPDIFSFWHSSQASGKGLNISGYKNETVDKLLENARNTSDRTTRMANYNEVQKIITAELPAIFLYEKNYIYVQSKKVKGFVSTAVVNPADRFAGVANWFLKYKNKFSW